MDIPEIFNTIKPFIAPLILVVAGLAAGSIFNRYILGRLEKITRKTNTGLDDILLEALRKYIRFWLFIIGLALALQFEAIPQAISRPAESVLLVFAIMSGALAVAGLTGKLVSSYTLKFSSEFQNTNLFVNLVRGLIIAIGVLMLLQTFGISITPILGAMGIGSLAAGFALKDTLANFFSGIQILLSKQIRTGDFIRLSSGQEGTITDITLRNTTLISRDNNTIVVPNATLAIETVLNYNIPKKNLRVSVDCGVAYDSDLEQVEKVTREVAQGVMETVVGGVPDYTVEFRYRRFNDSSIDFTAIMMATNFPAQHRVRTEFIKRLKKRFDAEGIQIPFPIRTIVKYDE